jgi:hypothetical protein
MRHDGWNEIVEQGTRFSIRPQVSLCQSWVSGNEFGLTELRLSGARDSRLLPNASAIRSKLRQNRPQAQGELGHARRESSTNDIGGS